MSCVIRRCGRVRVDPPACLEMPVHSSQMMMMMMVMMMTACIIIFSLENLDQSAVFAIDKQPLYILRDSTYIIAVNHRAE
jgi:hypothetical protein